jgi:hypothetical protein
LAHSHDIIMDSIWYFRTHAPFRLAGICWPLKHCTWYFQTYAPSLSHNPTLTTPKYPSEQKLIIYIYIYHKLLTSSLAHSHDIIMDSTWYFRTHAPSRLAGIFWPLKHCTRYFRTHAPSLSHNPTLTAPKYPSERKLIIYIYIYHKLLTSSLAHSHDIIMDSTWYF